MYEQIVSRDEEAILFHTPPLIEKKYKLNKSGRTITAFLMNLSFPAYSRGKETSNKRKK